MNVSSIIKLLSLQLITTCCIWVLFSSFSYASAEPLQHWNEGAWNSAEDAVSFLRNSSSVGTSYRIHNIQDNHAEFWQKVKLKHGEKYLFEANVSSERVGSDHSGALIGIKGLYTYGCDLRNTNKPQHCVLQVENLGPDREVELMMSLGYYGSLNTGTAIFSDIKWSKLGRINENLPLIRYGKPNFGYNSWNLPAYYYYPKNINKLLGYAGLGILMMLVALLWSKRQIKQGKLHTDKCNKTRQNIDILDGLRGIAILLVVIYHFWQISWLNHSFEFLSQTIDFNFVPISGFMGVEIFFYLSGFCLFLPIARKQSIRADKSYYLTFFYKRVIKILPSYVLSIVAICIINDIEFKNAGHFIQVLIAHLSFSTNLMNEFNIINGVYWSLCVEIQFYLIFPFVALLFKRWPIIISLLMCAIALGFRIYFLNSDKAHIIYFIEQMPAALDLFGLGMLGAYLVQRCDKLHNLGLSTKLLFAAAATAFIFTFIGIMSWLGDSRADPYLWQVHHRFTMGIILLALSFCAIFALPAWRRILANPLLIFFSVCSYNIYLWHQVIARYMVEKRLIPAETANPIDDLSWRPVFYFSVFVISTAIAALLTYGFERPIMRYGAKKLLANTSPQS